MLNTIIQLAAQYRASDVHLEVNGVPVFRIDGKIIKATNFPILSKQIMDNIFKQLSIDLSSFEQKRSYDTSYDTEYSRLRVHAYKTKDGDKLSLRLIPNKIYTLEELKLPSVVESFTKFKDGLVLVTGVTGSGKSSTLSALIQIINNRDYKHIITIEDPIEFVYYGGNSIISQREVPRDTISFSDAIREAMREDPDVILVGEMRDLETIKNAIAAAETGHLVFATLHSRNPAETIDRIVDVFPPYQQEQIRVQLSNVIQAIISQTLIPRKGGGRVPICEILIANQAIRSMLREKVSPNAIKDNIMTNHLKNKSQTYEQSIVSLYKQGLITTEAVLEFVGGSEDAMRQILLKN